MSRHHSPEVSPQQEMDEALQTADNTAPVSRLDQLEAMFDAVDAQSRESHVMPSATQEHEGLHDVVKGEVISSRPWTADTDVPTPLEVFKGPADAAAMRRWRRRVPSGTASSPGPSVTEVSPAASHRPSRQAVVEHTEPVAADLPKFPAPAPVETISPAAAATPVAEQPVRIKSVRPEYQAGQFRAVLTKNGARRLYRADANGKLRQVKQDRAAEHYGYAIGQSIEEQARPEPTGNDESTHDFSQRTADMDQATRDKLFENLKQTRQSEVATSPRLESVKRVGRAALRAPRKTMDVLNAIDDKILDTPATVKDKLAINERADKLNEWGLQKEAVITARAKRGVETALTAKEAVVTKLDKVDALPGLAGRKMAEHARVMGAKTKEKILERRRALAAGALAFLALSGVGLAGTSASVEARPAGDVAAAQAETKPDNTKLDVSTVFEALNGKKMTVTAPAPAVEASAQQASDAASAAKPHAEKPGPKQPEALRVADGDRVWNVLDKAGIPPAEIMQRLDAAAKASGLDYEWHGTGENRWLEVDGKSDVKSIVKSLDRFIKR